MFLMKEVESEDRLTNLPTVSMAISDDDSELNCLNDQNPTLSPLVPLVSVSFSH